MIFNRAIPRDPWFFNLQDFTTVGELDAFQVLLLLVFKKKKERKAFTAAKRTCFRDLKSWQANIRVQRNEYTSEIKGNLFQM